MKIIDAMMKISRGEEVKFKLLNSTDTIYRLIHGCYLYDEKNEEDVEWFIDEDWLNREIEIIEEDKEIKKLPPSFYENACLTKQDVDVANKINEIIKVINEMRKDK